MHPLNLIPLFACVAAAMMASAIVVHDPGQRANRVIALILACSAHWSLCEVLWSLQRDPQAVVWLVKLSSLGWVWLGPLCLELYNEVVGDTRCLMHRLRPHAYATAVLALALYVATPWCLDEPVRLSWGWAPRFRPAFAAVYLPTVLWVLLTLVAWPRFFGSGVASSERRQAWWVFASIAAPMTLATTTDVALPLLGVDVPRLGSTSLLITGGVVALSIRRHGYFLLAPGAFAREILESLRDGVALVSADGRIRAANDALARLAARPAGSLLGAPLEELLPLGPAAPAEALRDRELELLAETGEPIPVSVSSTPLSDERGRAMGQVLAIRDLRDVNALRQRLVNSGRLAAVGELAAGIAHEIANPISYVRSNLLELREQWSLLAEAADAAPKPGLEEVFREGEELIDESIEGVDRIGAVGRDVGAFSHAGRGRSEPLDVNELLDRALGLAALSFSVMIERCYDDLPRVRCDPQQLKQVFFNVLLNALQAVGDYGRIRIQTQRLDGGVCVRIQDDGPGIPEELLDRIFDPFFTTRPSQRLGLGLAHSFEIVRKHGGEIAAESRPGQGTTIEIRLPAAEATP